MIYFYVICIIAILISLLKISYNFGYIAGLKRSLVLFDEAFKRSSINVDKS